ncbi:HK97 gp10 family phage protein [Natrarchaeobaculum sulfurireducens]|uniref:Uncharacterized protein n=1 Tax=Natrarchaeobaculum sulfurireducens TaxID=2044521 RepID=A0A346PMP3_9EURY|nr:HK97 gp10 family phage protein [Natrarchaeobaculum sulfurireducens]AXR80788.1 hypothetical protein AArcMg_0766 [Natrarchaeobaculum sulfurireducens]
MHATIEWDGDGPEALAEAFEELPDVLLEHLADAAADIAARIRGDAQRNAPVSRGELEASIESVVTHVGTDLVRVVVGSNKDHAEPIERGTDPFFPPPDELRTWARRVLGDEDAAFPVARSISESGIDEQPYLRPALEDNLEWSMDRILQAIEASFAEVFG